MNNTSISAQPAHDIDFAQIRSLFLLDPGVIFLNHGSFGATPRPVFDAYQRWQLHLERQPVHFFSHELHPELERARTVLGVHLGAEPADLVFIPNATFGANLVARSLRLEPGDEILATDHEYGACNNVWQYVAARSGARYVQRSISLPVGSPEAIAEEIWQGVTPRTRVLYLSHITSPTALCLPVQELCLRAAAAGILTVVDGAHAPGQIPLDLQALGVDFYFGNCHKWLCAPKGAAFLYTQRKRQPLIEPLIVGWGWNADPTSTLGSAYLDAMQRVGTDDLSAYLAVPATIAFQEAHAWTQMRARCHLLLSRTVAQLCELTGLPSIYGSRDDLFHQMAVAPLPHLDDPVALKARLYAEHRIEVPVYRWQDRYFVRISVQAYNSADDLDRLVRALAELLPAAS